MLSRLLFFVINIVFFFCLLQVPFAQVSGDETSFISEENIEAEGSRPHFITVDILTPEDVEAAIIFYIREDINRKFSGLITNLKLEKIY